MGQFDDEYIEFEQGKPVEFPHTVNKIYRKEPLVEHLNDAFKEAGVKTEVSVVDCEEFPCVACGLLPGFTPAQIEVVGNTSLGGAWLALVDRTILPEMVAASVTAEVIELNLEPGFEDTFIDHLCLPV